MNQSPEGIVISESKVLTKKEKIIATSFSLVVIIGVSLFGWHSYQNKMGGGIVVPNLTVDSPAQPEISGFFYLSGFDPGVGMNTFILNPTTNLLESLTKSGNNWEFSAIDEARALLSAATDQDGEKNTKLMIADFSNGEYFNIETPEGYYKNHLFSYQNKLSKDSLIYSARSEPFTGEGSLYDSRMWYIKFGQPKTQSFEMISEAFSPVYVSDRNEIMYLTMGGLHVYSLTTKETYLVRTDLSGFSASSELALSPDKTKLILTAPVENAIILYDVTMGDKVSVTPASVVKVDNNFFNSPVVSPDGKLYAVYVYEESDDTPNARIEIRAFDNNVPIFNYPVNNLSYKSVRLNAWMPSLITETAKLHPSIPGDSHYY